VQLCEPGGIKAQLFSIQSVLSFPYIVLWYLRLHTGLVEGPNFINILFFYRPLHFLQTGQPLEDQARSR
jgi:hypothetical protein